MKVYNNYLDYNEDRQCILILGKFEGLHIGHKLLFEKARELKKLDPDKLITVITFAGKGKLLLTAEAKLDAIKAAGADRVILIPCDSELYNVKARDFVADIAVSRFGACDIICGEGFAFGKGREGDVKLLGCLQGLGYDLHVINKAVYKGEVVSSSRIREDLLAGEIIDANAMLGYEYSFKGVVVEGNRLGRQYNLPTANIAYDPRMVKLRRGVYASKVIIGDKEYNGLTNFGVKPSIAKDYAELLETYIYDFNEDLYGEIIEIRLINFFREERKFESVSELFVQINRDKAEVLKYLEQC